MKICIASDHAGVEAKAEVAKALRGAGHEVADFGPATAESVDYPDFAEKVGRAVAGGDCERGVLICGSGIGMSMAANKIHGVRAALVHDAFTAEMSRRHNDANVLCLGARILTNDQMRDLSLLWTKTEFEGDRHVRRVGKIMGLEQA